MWKKVPTFIRGETPGGEEFVVNFMKQFSKKKLKKFLQPGLLPNWEKGYENFTEFLEVAQKERKLVLLYLHDH